MSFRIALAMRNLLFLSRYASPLTCQSAPWESGHLSAKLTAMNIEIHNPELRARLQRQIETIGSGDIEETLQRLLETQEEHDRWLAANREATSEKIKRGLDQLDQGTGIPDTQLDSYLAKLKAKE
jgi:phage shock protein A